ncbi:Lipoteichoic acid synthase 2 [Blautia producta]|uniref:Lipoteichoic acid synthase 2 n=1 Tax=Blautia producta TaxID=33035 RepID=A0A4P6LYM8_9FIRM|nr:LTA synthase family protein [Blautia producta]QBE96330.1 Lipoteichoic acid synthase 2 [Blautia producta]
MNKKWLKYLNLLSLPIQMVVVMLGYFVIEAISRHSVGEAYAYMTERPLVFLYNSFLIFTTTLLVYLVRRRVFMRTLLAIFWLVLGIVNGVLLANRVTPFTGPDLHLLTDAFKIANKYLSPVFFVIVIVLAVAAIIGLVFLFLKGPKYQGKMTYKLNVPLVLAGVLAFAGTTKLALEKRVLSNYFGNIAFAYEDYGYPYCLATTIFNTGISCPRDYSEAAIDKIEKSESGLPETGEKRPNIIFLQLESFFDPTLVNFLNISEDPIPTFRKLMKEYSSGYYKVPSVGAGTANTEFESITGMSLRYFGPGEYPYKSILKETTCESAPYVLKNLGYSTHAIHNNEANFYGRKNVFANLGFDSFTSEEYMSEQDDTNPNDWMRDRNLTKYIMEALESSDDPDYIYTISVQGHGDYPEEPMIDDPKITVTGGESEAVNNKWEYYCNQIYEMDQFVKELTETLSKYDEDVVLVMYGDHLPTMGLKVKDVKNRYLFQTEYVIWDNMGLEKKDANVAAYQMAAEVMDRVGIHEGNIFRFHQARRQTKNYQVDLETLQYDILYGKQYVYDGENPFARTEMHLGVKDAVLEKIEKISDGRYYITGENFTQSAYVEVNGELLDATYISPTTLLLTDVELKDGDEVDVAIRSNSSTRKVLTRTDSMIYKVPVEPLAPEVPPLEGENTEGTGEIDPNAAGIEDGAAANPIGEENSKGTESGESPIEVPNTENPVQN